MRSQKRVVELIHIERIEVEKGVWEDSEVSTICKAEQLNKIFNRLDNELQEGYEVTARLSVRSYNCKKNLKYCILNNEKYKVNEVAPNVQTGFSIINLGGLV